MDPESVPVFHITHVRNLPSIIAADEILSDAARIASGLAIESIGMATIKTRRLALPVHCHAGTCVGEYVPFNFCPRSVMLFVIYCRNNPGLTYTDGQDPIVHLEFNLGSLMRWAETKGRPWAFTLGNAGANYAEFRSTRTALDEINWTAVNSDDFRAASAKEAKQAEFLLHQGVPWSQVRRIGVAKMSTHAKVVAAIGDAIVKPPVQILPDWYF